MKKEESWKVAKRGRKRVAAVENFLVVRTLTDRLDDRTMSVSAQRGVPLDEMNNSTVVDCDFNCGILGFMIGKLTLKL